MNKQIPSRYRDFSLCSDISILNFRTDAVELTGDFTDLLSIYVGLKSKAEVEELIYSYPQVLGEDETDEILYYNSKTWVEKTVFRTIEKIFKQTGYVVDFSPALVLTLFLKNRYTFINIPIDLFEKVQSPYEMYQFFENADDSTLSSLKIKFSTPTNANVLTLDIKTYQFLKRAIEHYLSSKDGKQYIDEAKSDYTIMASAIEKMKSVNQQDNIRQTKLELRTYFIPIVNNYYRNIIPDVKLRCLVIGELLAFILGESKNFQVDKDNILSKIDFYYPNVRKFFPKTLK